VDLGSGDTVTIMETNVTVSWPTLWDGASTCVPPGIEYSVLVKDIASKEVWNVSIPSANITGVIVKNPRSPICRYTVLDLKAALTLALTLILTLTLTLNLNLTATLTLTRTRTLIGSQGRYKLHH